MNLGFELGWKKLEPFKVLSITIGEIHDIWNPYIEKKLSIDSVYILNLQIAKLCLSIFISRSA